MSQLDFSVVVLGLKLHDGFEEEFRVVEYTCSVAISAIKRMPSTCVLFCCMK